MFQSFRRLPTLYPGCIDLFGGFRLFGFCDLATTDIFNAKAATLPAKLRESPLMFQILKALIKLNRTGSAATPQRPASRNY